MNFYSTRGFGPVSGAEAIVKGLADDGGLFVPETFPKVTSEEINDLCSLEYAERSAYVMSRFLTDFTYEELLSYTQKAYARFDGDAAPLTKVDDGFFLLELWHGPTLAFKDIALTVLPYLLTASKKKIGKNTKTQILVATSGDTGKAALEGFKDVDGTEITVLYPAEGVSDMQKKQMTTTEGKNVHVLGVKGNFDDAQNAVKRIFASETMKKAFADVGYELSSANSINFGRLVPQIAYYFSSYCDLVNAEEIEVGQEINFVVPSGNFGNILAGYYAKRMGLPVQHLIVASNKNDVLTDFFATGRYDANRTFHKTISPSMDILVSSNLERLLYEMEDRNAESVKELMTSLKEYGFYRVDEDIVYDKIPEFFGYCSNEEETKNTMDNFYDDYTYLIDPHTAVGVSAFFKYMGEVYDDTTPTVVVGTASPYKFPQSVLEAVGKIKEEDAEKAAKKLSRLTSTEIPEAISALSSKPVLHEKVADKKDIESEVLAFVGGKV